MIAKLVLKPLLSADVALLTLRIGTGLLLFINHGLEKILGLHQMSETFPNPIGIGPSLSFVFALIADAVCSILLMLGFLTRISSVLVFVNLITALLVVHSADISEIHGELIMLYLIAISVIFLYGPGNKSLDELILIKNK